MEWVLLFSHQVMSNSSLPLDSSMPGFPVPDHLPEFAQVHVHWIDDAIQPPHPLYPLLLLPSTFLASGSFPVSQLFTSSGQSVGAWAWASASVLSKSIQGWFPLRLTGLISLLSKGFLRVFSSTTVQKHQFFNALPSWWSSFHNHMWLLERP